MPTIESRLTALELEVTKLRAEMGPEPDFQRDGYLDNPVHTRMHEIGVAIDSCVTTAERCVTKVLEFQEKIDNLPTGNVVAPPQSDVKAALAEYGIRIAANKIGVGVDIDAADPAALQIGGDAAAVVLGVSNTKGTDGQNPTEVHKNSLVVADNDGGMRFRQYLQWTSAGRVRNTTNRRASVFALDSQGDVCKSTLEIGAESDGGQSWYIRTVGNVVEICTYKVGAFVRILKSVSGYGATDSAQL